MTTNQAAQIADEHAAPLDLLLVNSTKSFAKRMAPNSAWLRFGTELAKKPGTVVGAGVGLVKEIGEIAIGRSERAPARGDQRFRDPAWSGNPLLKRVEQSYLAACDAAETLYESADLSWRDAEQLRFALDNILEGLSPTNNVLLNPLGWKAIIDTGGLSVYRGLRAFARDMSTKPRVPSMVDPDAFHVGETTAATPGAVVFRTRMLEVIQYRPTTEQVSTTPLVVVPPVINKYYVLDIAPGRSMVEHLLSRGHQVFMISWRNPKARHREWGMDAYAEAIIEVLAAVREISGAPSTHIMAACSGGILAAMVTALLSSTGRGDLVSTLTLLVTVLDQSQAGVASALVDREAAESAIKSSAAKGYLEGAALSEMFAWLRPTDLVWRYVVNNYIQGRTPAAFDVLFWNADSTNMTAALHRDMVRLGLDNLLVTPGEATLLGTPIDLSKITCPSYVVGGINDHICPWQSTYRSAALLGGDDATYVLSTAGHIAALVNPPGNKKSSYRIGPVSRELSAEQWRQDIEPESGSWWTAHAQWLSDHGDGLREAPENLGAPGFTPVAPAPGTYVLES
ncbi:MAG: alpha/beta fold hydrolase [Gordonia sp. (in: high G+C Gram-positive bacteria)]|uniref:PHA/PHB synthase family protein n=1 Tax=Gordonia sp. (in: high G+C Gram-positive bacteria) TaxID=84139 RepID=UPI0039E669F6